MKRRPNQPAVDGDQQAACSDPALKQLGDGDRQSLCPPGVELAGQIEDRSANDEFRGDSYDVGSIDAGIDMVWSPCRRQRRRLESIAQVRSIEHERLASRARKWIDEASANRNEAPARLLAASSNEVPELGGGKHSGERKRRRYRRWLGGTRGIRGAARYR